MSVSLKASIDSQLINYFDYHVDSASTKFKRMQHIIANTLQK